MESRGQKGRAESNLSGGGEESPEREQECREEKRLETGKVAAHLVEWEGDDLVPRKAAVFWLHVEKICAGVAKENSSGKQERSGVLRKREGERCSSTILSAEQELRRA